ncbi:bacillithiol system redox-active protein YtxJ [Metabacillus fastidiosus]|uniref:bacillithiol system redox-active protein YtxJ n=1 Tax=Metabacillus fastidiosus TaxID=1458 RepID=UPI003D275249
MNKIIIETVEQFKELENKHDTFLFLKNSVTCPISQGAFDEFNQFISEHKEVPAYYLNVQTARELSNYIAETFQIKHESPQILLIKNKEVIWNTSHSNITYDKLKKAVLQ